MITQIVILTVVLFAAELAYFFVARRYRIQDIPNQRSSHHEVTIRGGGIIFYIAVCYWFVANGFPLPWYVMGVTLMAVIGLIDDLSPQPARLRLSLQTAAVLLVFYQSPFYGWPLWLTITALVVSVGAVNAFNFMDGINGITGVYAFVNLVTFAFADLAMIPFTDFSLILAVIVSVVIFLFFNFRRKAVCFAGDVGSTVIALVQIFFLIQLIQKTNSYIWVILFLVYGVDSVATILIRLAHKENIFNAHRTHLYQFLSNELKVPHRYVAILYGILQASLNVLLLCTSTGDSALSWALSASGVFILIYLVARWLLQKHIIKYALKH